MGINVGYAAHSSQGRSIARRKAWSAGPKAHVGQMRSFATGSFLAQADLGMDMRGHG